MGGAMPRRPNLVLLGFMGTGKTTLGRRVAALGRRAFLDMDVEIEKRAGKPIPKIFEEDGERAFRDLETALAKEWGSTVEGAVISCGGGVVLREENLAALGENGRLVCLWARPEVILERTGRAKNRPLLETQDREKKIRDLLAARASLYAQIPMQVDTSDADPHSLAQRLLAWLEG
jgi:shikimate kinase